VVVYYIGTQRCKNVHPTSAWSYKCFGSKGNPDISIHVKLCGQFNSPPPKKNCFHSSGSAPCSNLTSIKIMMFWTSLLAYVLIQAYGATLMSHITAVISWKPTFNNLEGLLQSKYTLAVVSGSDIHSALEVRNSV